MESKRNILITGGAGFIGSHVVRLFVNKYPDYHIINLDKLTYAGNLANLHDIKDKPNYTFIKADICDFETVLEIIRKYNVDGIIHLAAESHVDRSIKDPFTFANTNVIGTLSMLQAARIHWESQEKPWEINGVPCLFYHISTDEVYGTLEITAPDGLESPFSTKASSAHHHVYGEKFFTEENSYHPHSPYSAAKAASDHFVRSFHDTYGMPVNITRCSNNYGPYQFPEKLIPLMINNVKHHKQLPVYGDGMQIRDWLYVEDHCKAIDMVANGGKIGEVYNVGGHNERPNIFIVKTIINQLHDRLQDEGISEELIKHVADRLGHDRRYGIDPTKIKNDLGWYPETPFEKGIVLTIDWYLNHEEWMNHVTSGDYQNYYQDMYKNK